MLAEVYSTVWPIDPCSPYVSFDWVRGKDEIGSNDIHYEWEKMRRHVQ